jgi:hypothetical protein
VYIHSTNLNAFYDYVLNFSPIENVDYETNIQIIGKDSGTVYSQQLPVPFILVQSILSQFSQI